jgi:hypothetical protein
MQKQRAERRAQGWREANLWLTPEAQQRIARLLDPGETLGALFDRALAALDAIHSGTVTKPITRDIPSEVTREDDLSALIAREVTRYLISEAFHEQQFMPALQQSLTRYLPREITSELTQEPSPVKALPSSKTEVLRRIRELKAEGFSLQHIADRLNADGVPTISGRGKWRKGTIGNLLAQAGEA